MSTRTFAIVFACLFFLPAVTLAQALSDSPMIQLPSLTNQKNLLHGARAPLRPTSSHATTTDRPAGHSHKGAKESALQTLPFDKRPTKTELEAEADFGYGAELVVNSRFIWRGQNYSRGPALQPTLWGSYRGLEASLWGNFNVSSDAEPGLTVLVPSTSYTYELDWGTVGGGVALYVGTSTEEVPPTAGEAYITASLARGPFGLRTTHYLHYLGSPGAYYGEAGPTVTVDGDLWSFAAGTNIAWASAAYTDFYFKQLTLGITLVAAQATLARSLGDVFYAQAQFEGSLLVNDHLSAQRPVAVGSFGLGLGVNF